MLLSGIDFSVESAIAFTYKVLKYFMGADAKLIKRKEKEDKIISFIIRHDGGDKFSYFCACCFYHFFNSFSLKHVVVDHDQSSVYIEIDLVEDEVESMKRYLESIQEDIKKIKSRLSNNNNENILRKNLNFISRLHKHFLSYESKKLNPLKRTDITAGSVEPRTISIR